ncbi:MAG TPA: Ig-like domain-containing protein [Candidatus Angelobacter sp.]|jgi:YD repeat-containing protein|nr:Ig-like domain-containing protein [Candidatus Angelobacter sp.]
MIRPIAKTKLIVLSMLACAVLAAAQTNSPIQYFYDDLGRLVKVVDGAGNVATYSYDAVGNILKISRSTLGSPANLAILNFTPQQGAVGTTVTLQGQGFSPTASQNSVFFNGAQASVTSATSTTLVVTVPANASTGPLSVTVNGKNATSDASFIVIPAPIIASVSPKLVVSSATPLAISNFTVTGTSLNTASFVFQPQTVPAPVNINSVSVDPSGTSATLSLTVSANVSGAFTLVATNGSTSSSLVPSSANTLRVLDPNKDDDNDGLTNAVEFALGTDPLNPSTMNDGITDGWKVFYGLNPLDASVASQDPDGDGLTNLQEFQLGTDPHNPDRTPPAVAQINPANNATSFLVNGKVVVRFTEPLLSGIPLSRAQGAISAVTPSLPASEIAAAAQTLQAYVQGTCCGTSIVPGVVNLFQGTTPVSGSVQGSNDGLSVTFTPAQQLSPTTAYSVQVNSVRDLAGNRMTQQFQSGFTTGTLADAVPPSVVNTSPANGANNVPINVAYTVQFSKIIDPATLTPQSFSITDQTTFQPVPGTIQVDASGLTASFVPNPPLAVGRQFSVFLNSDVKDTFGNSLNSSFSNFTTSFTADTDAPHLLATSPADGSTNVPTNAVITLAFNEPLDSIVAATAVQVSGGGQVVAGSIALSSGNRFLTFTPAAPLAANTLYTITVSPAITDLANRLIDNAGSSTFQTGSTADTNGPQVLSGSPADGSVGVSIKTIVQLQFSKPVNPATVTSDTLQVFPRATGAPIPGTVLIAADGQSVTFTPSFPLLLSTEYVIQATNGIIDLEGQGLRFFGSSFVTSAITVTVGPQIVAVSPQDGSTGVPINAKVVAVVSAPVEPLSVNNGSITLSAGGTTTAGTVTLSPDRTRLTFAPTAPLAINTAYTAVAGDVTDTVGNAVTPFTFSFTTGSSQNRGPLQVSTVTPANGATSVPVNSTITLTFNEVVDPTTVNVNSIQISVPAGRLAGNYAVNGATVTFTPISPLPGKTSVQVFVTNALLDQAGNGANFFFSSFTTGVGTDATLPQVVAVTPNDGATNIGPNATVVLTFSKSLNPRTVNGNTVALLSGSGAPLGSNIGISADNRTVTLQSFPLPSASTVTVIATSGIQDMVGNALPDFRSQFSTAAGLDRNQASVANQRPGNGASGVALNSSIVLFVTKPLNPATVLNAIHASQNGSVVQGTVTVSDNGQAIQFAPTVPWQNNALVQVFLDNTAIDADGVPVNSYQGSFRTAADTANTSPDVIATSILAGTFFNPTVVPTNAVLEFQYNEPLDPNSVNINTVLLDGFNGLVAGTVTLDSTGTLVRFIPTIPLAANTNYFFQTTNGIQGLNGLTQGFSFNSSISFNTGDSADTTPPVVSAISPPDGSVAVPGNADIHLRFNKPINPLTATAGTIQVSGAGRVVTISGISFSNNNQDVILAPQEPLPASTQMTITVAGVQDVAGNAVVARTTQFTTGNGVATVQPVVRVLDPADGANEVPVNTRIILQSDTLIDPSSLSGNSVQLVDGLTRDHVAGTASLAADGRTISFVPNAPLAVSRGYTIFVGSMTDLAGNPASCAGFFCFFFGSAGFNTSAASDTTLPTVIGISPADQLTGVPINAQVVVRFNKPIDGSSIGQVTLNGAGNPVVIVPTTTDGQQTLILTPAVPLSANTQYVVTVTGIQDASGNAMAGTVTAGFTTGAGADFIRPQVVSVSPADGAVAVPTNAVAQVQFNKRVDQLTVNQTTFQMVPPQGNPITTTVTVSADGQSAVLTPTTSLVPSTTYRINLSNGITDLSGLSLGGFSAGFTTGTGVQAAGPQVVAVSPQNGSSGVPVNAHVVVALNEPVEPLSVGANAIAVSSGGGTVAGVIGVSNDRKILTFTPSSLLAASTTYSVVVGGFADAAGNPATSFTSSFVTSISTTPDQSPLQVRSVNPANGATAVAVNSTVVLTFTGAVDSTTVNSSSINIGVTGPNFFFAEIAGSYAVNGSTVTFTPLNPLPGNSTISVRVLGSLLNLVGNSANFFSSSFTTTAIADTTAPQVVAVTPADGSINVGLNATVVLTFSKSLNPTTVNGSTFGLLSGSSVPLNAGVTISADNRTVMLNAGTLPPSSVVTVVTSSSVQDLSGNSAPPFRSQFTTGSAFDTSHASVIGQRPGNGASSVPLNSSVALFVNEPLDPATAAAAFHVSQNGILAPGTVSVKDSGQTLEFVPANPWINNALIGVSLDSTALETDGNPVNGYQGSFRTVADTSAVPPAVINQSPSRATFFNPVFTPRNVVLEVQYNEPLNPTTVNTNSVVLQSLNTGQFVAGTVSLDPSGTLVRFVPTAPLASNGIYSFQTTTDIQGINGLPEGFNFNNSFTFTTTDQIDNVPPVVTSMSPPDGSVAVPVNADIHVKFSEPINPLTATAASIQVSSGGQTLIPTSISFSNNNQEAIFTPLHALPDNTQMTVSIAGVEDLAGNPVVGKTTQFTTGSGPTTVQPVVTVADPLDGSTNVPVNTQIIARSNAVLDPSSINGSSLQVSDNSAGQRVTGTASLSVDGLIVSFVPNGGQLTPNHNYTISIGGMTDLAGNPATCAGFFCFFFGSANFTTGTAVDATSPNVVGVSPPDQLNGVPINSQVVVRFDKAIESTSLSQVIVSTAGSPITVVPTLTNGQTTLILTPAVPLAANTQYTLTVAGVKDLSGNVLAATTTTTFTTGPGADLTRPQISSVAPSDRTNGVPTNTVVQVNFSKRVDALTVAADTFQLFPSGGNAITGTIVVSTDGQNARFTPSSPLLPNTSYQIRLSSGITDLIGQSLTGFFGFSTSFTTGAQ